MHKEIDGTIRKAIPTAVNLRRSIHHNPELSGKEFQTAALIFKRLQELGLKPRYHLDKTAVTAYIRNGRGACIALRADIDALPIQEETGLPFASKNKGVMHACGHDMHTATLLGAAEVLINMTPAWKGSILLVFQPSEEAEPGGAYGLLKAGAIPENTRAIFGLHVNNEHPTGIIGLREGVDYAGILAFDVVVKGKGGHGAYPEKTVDPICCAAFMITQLQTLISREKNSFTPAVLSIGKFQGGTLRNIIPDQVEFQGTIRCHSKATLAQIASRISEMLQAAAGSFRASVEITFQSSYPPTVNDPELTQRFATTFSKFNLKNAVEVRANPTMLAEDFGFYQEKIPGLFIHLGVNDGKNGRLGIHTSRFNPDENAIKTGILAHCTFVFEMLGVPRE